MTTVTERKKQAIAAFRGAAKQLTKEITLSDLAVASKSQEVVLFTAPADALIVLACAEVTEAFVGLSDPKVKVGDQAGTKDEHLKDVGIAALDVHIGGKNLAGDKTYVAVVSDPTTDLDQATAGKIMVEALYIEVPTAPVAP